MHEQILGPACVRSIIKKCVRAKNGASPTVMTMAGTLGVFKSAKSTANTRTDPINASSRFLTIQTLVVDVCLYYRSRYTIRRPHSPSEPHHQWTGALRPKTHQLTQANLASHSKGKTTWSAIPEKQTMKHSHQVLVHDKYRHFLVTRDTRERRERNAKSSSVNESIQVQGHGVTTAVHTLESL